MSWQNIGTKMVYLSTQRIVQDNNPPPLLLIHHLQDHVQLPRQHAVHITSNIHMDAN